MTIFKTKAILLSFLPGLILIPVLIQFIQGIHPGGIPVIIDFIKASLNPSLENVVLTNTLNSLLVTLCTAFLSWLLSIIAGTFLGLISSNLFWQTDYNSKRIPFIISQVFAVPRGIHELLWALILQNIFGLSPIIAIMAISIPYSFLFARTIRNELEVLDIRKFIALKQFGAGKLNALITCIVPQITPKIISHAGYRLECAIRGATLLGIFGLGGIGTELELTLKSLRFNEMWTSLWILCFTMVILEYLIHNMRIRLINLSSGQKKYYISLLILFIPLILISINLLIIPNINELNIIRPENINLPSLYEYKLAVFNLEWNKMIFETLILTVSSASIAIGIPPIIMFIIQNKRLLEISSSVFLFFRLIPPPLSALLLLISNNPSISVASLALGLHNSGIMGRILKEGIESQSRKNFNSLVNIGTEKRIAWLYTLFNQESKSYIAYAGYRMDIILRETTIVGIVGGVGLGWQLQESLTSFAWAEVIILMATYIFITLTVEFIANKYSLIKSI